MDARIQIIKALQKITNEKNINVETPEREEFGDYSTNVALATFDNSKLQITNNKWGSAIELAEYIRDQILKDENLVKIIDKIEIDGPGFINFYLKTDILLDNLIQIVSKDDEWTRNTSLRGKKIMIEFAHPNTHKLFHIGHLRNITTGESISRILESSGADVVRVNYQGDVGLHIAKAIWGIQKIGFKDPNDLKARAEFLGEAYAKGNKAYEENDANKEEIHKINEAIYEGKDEYLMDLYKKTRDWSLDYFDYIYKRVYTKFDRFYFESEVARDGYELSKKALKDGILKESEDAVIFPGSKYGLHDRVFITQRNVLTYEGKDMGLANLQFKEYNPDLLIHLVGPEQSEYFKVVFKALEFILPKTKGKEMHLPYGWVRLKEGKMSSRTGNVVKGDWLLDQAKSKLIELYKSDDKTAEDVAVGAVKYSFLKNGLNQEIAFDLNESISLEGNSGPYLQYTFARTQSVLNKSKRVKEREGKKMLGELVPKNYQPEPEELIILRTLVHYPGVVTEAAEKYAPNLICNYLFQLAQKFNTFYNKYRIIDDKSVRVKERENIKGFRLYLTDAVGVILRSGLELLGINTPEKM